jgi:hypothetical protein
MLLLLGATRAEHPTASARPPLTPHSHTAAAQVSTTTAAGSRAPTAHQDTLPLDPFSRFAPLNLRSKCKTSDSIRSSSRCRQHATALHAAGPQSPCADPLLGGHYRKDGLCSAPKDLPGAFYRAHGKCHSLSITLLPKEQLRGTETASCT